MRYRYQLRNAAGDTLSRHTSYLGAMDALASGNLRAEREGRTPDAVIWDALHDQIRGGERGTMSEDRAKYDAGPERVRSVSQLGVSIRPDDEIPGCVRVLTRYNVLLLSPAEAEGLARALLTPERAWLLDAAPDLLAALKDVAEMVHRVRGFWQAQGCIAGMPGRSDEERVTGWAVIEIANRAIAKAEGMGPDHE